MELSAIVGRKSKFDVIDGVAIVETVIDSGDLFDGREIAGEVITYSKWPSRSRRASKLYIQTVTSRT